VFSWTRRLLTLGLRVRLPITSSADQFRAAENRLSDALCWDDNPPRVAIQTDILTLRFDRGKAVPRVRFIDPDRPMGTT
jgi:hypothetical protein